MRLLLILGLLLVTNSHAQKPKDKFKLTCSVELENSNRPKVITQSIQSPNLPIGLKLLMEFSPYVLNSVVVMSGKDSKTMRPTLTTAIYEGSPLLTDNYTSSTSSGFEKSLLSGEVFETTGTLKRKFQYEGVGYTNIYYECAVKAL